MQYGVNYSLKHGEQFFYKLTNEEDGINYKIVKIPLPTKYLLLSESNESSEYKPKDKNELEVIKKERFLLPGNREIDLPRSNYLQNRGDALEVRNKNELQLFGPTELIKTNYDAKILDFEVTKHYM
jgi:protease II